MNAFVAIVSSRKYLLSLLHLGRCWWKEIILLIVGRYISVTHRLVHRTYRCTRYLTTVFFKPTVSTIGIPAFVIVPRISCKIIIQESRTTVRMIIVPLFTATKRQEWICTGWAYLPSSWIGCAQLWWRGPQMRSVLSIYLQYGDVTGPDHEHT